MGAKIGKDIADEMLSGQKDVAQAISALAETVQKQSKKIDELHALLKEKDVLIVELRERLNKNSRNSSKPSSSDFFNKPRPSSSNKGPSPSSKKRKAGAMLEPP